MGSDKNKSRSAFYNDICTLLVAIAENAIGQWMVYEHINGGISRGELPSFLIAKI